MPHPETSTPQPTDLFRFRVDRAHIDGYNHLHHVGWGKYLEAARMEANEQTSTFIDGVPAVYSPLQGLFIQYNKQIKEGEDIDIVTRIESESHSAQFHQILQNNGALVGTAQTMYGEWADAIQPIDTVHQATTVVLDEEYAINGTLLHHLAAPYIHERERIRYLLERNLGMRELIAKNTWVMVRTLDVKYMRPLHAGASVELVTALDQQRGRLVFRQQMLEDGQVINASNTSYVVLNESGPQRPGPMVEALLTPPIASIPHSRDLKWE